MDTTKYLKAIRENDGVIPVKLIGKVIEDHATTRTSLKRKYERYKASVDGTPILSRQLEIEGTNKINNKLHSPFMSEIVDTKIGYFMGTPISYLNDKVDMPETVTDFNRRANIEDLDTEKSKLAAICGYSSELLYIDKEGNESAVYVKPWEVIFFGEEMSAPDYALRYIPVLDDNGDEKYQVEFYNDEYIHYFIQVKDEYEPELREFYRDGALVEDTKQLHMFKYCPLFAELNNDELQGDCDKVLTLMDAYDRTFSDVNSEIEQLRLAYMAITGMSIGDTAEEEDAFIERLKRTGVIELDENGKVEFVTKNLNDTVIEHHLDRLEKRIEIASKNVNFADKEFAGLSGVALMYKLFNLESKCKIAENKKKKALRYRYKVLCSSWNERGNELDYKDFTFKFTRNVFVDYKAEAETLEKLRGNVSDETAYSLMSFISDPIKEQETMKMEQEEKAAQFAGMLPSIEEEEE